MFISQTMYNHKLSDENLKMNPTRLYYKKPFKDILRWGSTLDISKIL